MLYAFRRSVLRLMILSLFQCVALVSPGVAEGAARAVAVAAAEDVRFEVQSELDMAAVGGFAAAQQLVGAAGTTELAEAWDADYVITVNAYSLANETRVALAARDIKGGGVLGRADVGAVAGPDTIAAVRAAVPSLLARLPVAGGASARLFVSGGRVDAIKTLTVGRARRPARVEPRSGLRFVLVPGGVFDFGCITADARCPSGEQRRRETMSSFWIGQTEVPFAAWDRCVRAGSCLSQSAGPLAVPELHSAQSAEFASLAASYSAPPRPASAGGHDHAVYDVDAVQAAAFCAWSGGRLPTAVEWEYAARAGADVVYPWGNEDPTPKRTTLPTENWLGGAERPVPRFAGGYRHGGNRWGLLDFSGGLFEWTSTAPVDGSREIRGGSYLHAHDLRIATRAVVPANVIAEDLGFRCVLPVEDATNTGPLRTAPELSPHTTMESP